MGNLQVGCRYFVGAITRETGGIERGWTGRELSDDGTYLDLSSLATHMDSLPIRGRREQPRTRHTGAKSCLRLCDCEPGNALYMPLNFQLS
jgi:hypothetical protein